YVQRIIFGNDLACYDKLRMGIRAFYILCEMLQTTGKLPLSKNSSVQEMVAMFLFTLAHDAKHRVLKADFVRSEETISRHNEVLHAVIHLHKKLLVTHVPIPNNSVDDKWKWLKNFLGALDGTHIPVHVLDVDKVTYQNRKGELTTNVLTCCSQEGLFTYILPGWEGSAADSRILRDAISRTNGLKVPQGI
ncbi:LOW QUALITY PROTEIN: DDE_4 domain-containing protein, partial [Cephalotus follicularis]